MNHLWDFNENKNFIKVGNYKVLDVSDADKASELLKKIHILIIKTFIKIKTNEPRTNELDLLVNTPFYLQEMQLPKDQKEIIFEGLNKPKNVKSTKHISIGKDGKLRAEYRLIFLKLRDDNGKLKNINSLKKLISHELAHTAMNHVRWRDDDHDANYQKTLKIINKYI